MKNTILTYCLIILSTILFGQTANITLIVSGLPEVKGNMSIAVYDNADDFPGKENYAFAEDLPVNTKPFKYVIKDIPKGKYAIAVYHDLDKNGEMNKNWIGMPKEPYGFSNNVMGKMGPPKFEDAAFVVNQNVEVEIILKD